MVALSEISDFLAYAIFFLLFQTRLRIAMGHDQTARRLDLLDAPCTASRALGLCSRAEIEVAPSPPHSSAACLAGGSSRPTRKALACYPPPEDGFRDSPILAALVMACFLPS